MSSRDVLKFLVAKDTVRMMLEHNQQITEWALSFDRGN